MTRLIEIAGASGVRYRYTRLDEERAIPPSGANFVIAQVTEEGPSILYAGETDNLSRGSWREALKQAKALYGDANVLTRLNVTSAVRRAEREDVVQAYRPPMNAEPGA